MFVPLLLSLQSFVAVVSPCVLPVLDGSGLSRLVSILLF